jgi:ABC-type polar amino acid transport system ATPase subunit
MLKVIKDLVLQYRKIMIIVTHQLYVKNTIEDRVIFIDSLEMLNKGKNMNYFLILKLRGSKLFYHKRKNRYCKLRRT